MDAPREDDEYEDRDNAGSEENTLRSAGGCSCCRREGHVVDAAADGGRSDGLGGCRDATTDSSTCGSSDRGSGGDAGSDRRCRNRNACNGRTAPQQLGGGETRQAMADGKGPICCANYRPTGSNRRHAATLDASHRRRTAREQHAGALNCGSICRCCTGGAAWTTGG